MSDCCVPCVAYATIDDWNDAALPAAAVSNLETIKIQKALMRASRVADTFLRDRYALPLRAPIDPALTEWVIQIAVYFVMSVRGFNPNGNAIDAVVRMNYDDATRALTRVANGQQQLCVRQADPPSDQPMLATSESRGFTDGGNDPTFVGPNTWGN